ncbi:MAG: MarR family transcriptional regulator [Flavobacteriales bacterium]|nr:MarR family transcriptional regulator [Flavobacteriales bacterium]
MAKPTHNDAILNAHLARLLERIAEVSRALRWRQATSAGLSPLQIRILGFVSEHPGESVGVARLAEELQVTRPTVSDSVATPCGSRPLALTDAGWTQPCASSYGGRQAMDAGRWSLHRGACNLAPSRT